jgi:hypothetical protein
VNDVDRRIDRARAPAVAAIFKHLIDAIFGSNSQKSAIYGGAPVGDNRAFEVARSPKAAAPADQRTALMNPPGEIVTPRAASAHGPHQLQVILNGSHAS